MVKPSSAQDSTNNMLPMPATGPVKACSSGTVTARAAHGKVAVKVTAAPTRRPWLRR
ncbi:hypothetical protein GCM10027176_85170 [Actinoallomurus bryophytorum]